MNSKSLTVITSNSVYPKKYKSSMPVDGPGITTRTVREKKKPSELTMFTWTQTIRWDQDWTDVYSEMSVPILIEGKPSRCNKR